MNNWESEVFNMKKKARRKSLLSLTEMSARSPDEVGTEEITPMLSSDFRTRIPSGIPRSLLRDRLFPSNVHDIRITMEREEGFSKPGALVVTLAIVVLLSAYWLARPTLVNDQIVCTQEARLCPDGSSVERTGPNCTFAACPGVSPSISPVSSIDTSNWKTYRNEKYGFEVRYPGEWNVNIIESPGIETAIQIMSPSAQKGQEGTHSLGPIFDIRIVVNKAYQGRITGQKIKFLGKNAIDTGWYTSNVGGLPVRDIVIIDDPEITISFGGTLLESQKTEESLLDPILSTFKFIEPQAIIDTLNWKTYRNEKYGFTFQYPAEVNLEIEEPNNYEVFAIGLVKELYFEKKKIPYTILTIDITTPASIKIYNSACDAPCTTFKPLDCENGTALCSEYAGMQAGGSWVKRGALTKQDGNIRAELWTHFIFSPGRFKPRDDLTLKNFVSSGEIDERDLELLELFNAITSTFKFVE